MRGKIVAVLLVVSMLAAAFAATAGFPGVGTAGTPEIVISRVAPAPDGTHSSTPANAPNGICYVWEQAEAFSPGISVSTFGTNTKGIAIDVTGTWTYNAAYDQCSADAGSIWDAWAVGERGVMIYEVFNDQSTSGRNYTMIFEEDSMDGDGATNFGTYSAQNALTVINDPYLISFDGWTCVIGIAPQTTGFEVSSLFDGYGVYKSTTGPITQTNQGTFLGDATLDGGVWKYTDTGVFVGTWYAVKVKWNGGTYPFYAPRYSYGMSNDLEVLGGHYLSRATGPVGSSASKSLTITYNQDCTCFGDTFLYYSSNRNVTWNYIGMESQFIDEDGFFPWNAPGSGEYWWYAANGEGFPEDGPGSGTPAEAGPYVIQTGAPISNVNAVSPYWRNLSPATVTANATAYGGATVSNVTLYYSFSSNNVSWGSWNSFGPDVASPWEWSFSWPSGQGYYRFYSYAKDSIGRVEEYTPTIDARAGYDATPPEHLVGIPVLKETSQNPCNISSMMADMLSGMASHTMYYSFGSVMGPYLFWGTQASGTFAFNWPMGEGTYYFMYSGYDRAGNFGPAGPLGEDSWTYYLPLPSYKIPVNLGWNLISFPVDAAGAPNIVLNDNGGNTFWSTVKWYNPQTPMDPWKTYRFGGTANDLTFIDNSMGLWIYIINLGSDAMLELEGEMPASSSQVLRAGWNLVGYPTLTNETVANAFWGTGVDRVEVFNPTQPGMITGVGPTYLMQPGRGYWVHTNSDRTWTVDW